MNISVDYISLKHGSFRVDSTIFPKNTENSTIWRKQYLKSFNLRLHLRQITRLFWQLWCAVLFYIRNRIFTYVLFPVKHKKFANLSSKFPEILPLKDGNFFKEIKKYFPITRMFRQLAACSFYVLWRNFFWQWNK